MVGSEAGVERRVVRLAQAPIAYRELGDGPPVVFVHGVLVNGDLWHAVAPAVAAAGFRCVVPDLPLGAHRLPADPGADLTPTGVADLLADLLEALDLDDVTIVANDTGGAITQLLLTRRHDRVARVVLTNCDAMERFFPPLFRTLEWLGRVPGGAWLIAQLTRPRALLRLPLLFGWLTKRGLSRRLTDSFFRPARTDPDVRRDLQRFLRAVDSRLTVEASRRFPEVAQPVLLAWAAEDRHFPLELGQRLQRAFRDAELVVVEDAYTFVPIDQPERLVQLIVEFAGRANASGVTP